MPVPGAIAVATFEFAGADSSELTFLPGALWTVGTSDATQSSNLTNPDAVDAWRCLAALYPTLHEPRTPHPTLAPPTFLSMAPWPIYGARLELDRLGPSGPSMVVHVVRGNGVGVGVGHSENVAVSRLECRSSSVNAVFIFVVGRLPLTAATTAPRIFETTLRGSYARVAHAADKVLKVLELCRTRQRPFFVVQRATTVRRPTPRPLCHRPATIHTIHRSNPSRPRCGVVAWGCSSGIGVGGTGLARRQEWMVIHRKSAVISGDPHSDLHDESFAAHARSFGPSIFVPAVSL